MAFAARLPLSRPLLALALLLACSAVPLEAQALLIEGNNGLDAFPDQPGDPINFVPGNPTELVADPGVNLALGYFSCFGFACRDDFDSFRLVIPAGLQLVRTDFFVDNNDGTAEQLFLFPGGAFTVPADPLDPAWKSGNLIGLTDYFGLNGPDPATSTTVLGPGTYDFVAYNFNLIGGGAWRAELTLAAVPEPGTAMLFGLGLAGLAARGRRRSL